MDIKNLPQLELSLRDEEWEYKGTTHERNIVRAIVYDDSGYFYFARLDRDDIFGKAIVIETSGGGVESGEDLEEAILREISEELGIEGEIILKIGVVKDYYNLIGRRNVNNYYLLKAERFGEAHLTEDEKNTFHLSMVRHSYESAVAEYERCSLTPLGALIYNREMPILKRAKEILDNINK